MDGYGRDRTEPGPSLWSVFSSDLRSSLTALRAAPGLVALTVGLVLLLQLAQRLEGAGPFLGLPVEVFLTGFVGTQRVWFVRLYRGLTVSSKEVWPLTYAFLGRFIVLGLAASVPVAVLEIVDVAVIASRGPYHGKRAPLPGFFRPSLFVVLLGLDVALTFVVPMLALSTRSARNAISHGLRMLSATWPACAWYVLAPGLTVTALGVALPRSSVGPWGLPGVAVIGGLAGLWFKGAVVAFYLRQQPDTDPDGAAYLARPNP